MLVSVAPPTMTNCVWLLIGSHGTGTTISIVLQFIICIMSLCVSVMFLLTKCKSCMGHMQKRSTRNAQTLRERESWIIKLVLNIELIVVPLLFTINTIITIPNFTLDLNREMALNDHDSWNDKIKSQCHFNNELISIDSTISLITAISSLLSYLGLISIYFTRLVIIFLNSIYSINKKVKITFGIGTTICVAIITCLVVIIIIIGSVNSRVIGSILVGIGLIIFIGLTVYFHKTLMKQFGMIINLSKSMNMHMNSVHVNNHNFSRHNINNISTSNKLKKNIDHDNSGKIKSQQEKIAQVSPSQSPTLAIPDTPDTPNTPSTPNTPDTPQITSQSQPQSLSGVINNINVKIGTHGRVSRSRSRGDEKARAFWRTLVRLTVLYLVALLSTGMITIVTIFVFTMGYFDKSIEVRCILTVFMQLDCFINILCICFQFPQFEKGYTFFCAWFDTKLNDKYDQYTNK